LNDDSLSWKAKGILSYLLSKPDDWQIFIEHLKTQSTDGRDSTRTGIHELINAGYVSKQDRRNEVGQIVGVEYIVRENPVKRDDEPITENPKPVKAKPENPTLLNTDSIPNTEKTKNDDVPAAAVSSHDDLDSLVEAVPESRRTKAIKAKVQKALPKYGYEYVLLAIPYSLANSNGNLAAYFGKCVDEGWHEGYDPKEDPQAKNEARARQRAIDDMQKLSSDTLKTLAAAGNRYAKEVLESRGEK